MKYIKIKYTRTKDEMDDAITRFVYDEVDVKDFVASRMDNEYLYAKVKD